MKKQNLTDRETMGIKKFMSRFTQWYLTREALPYVTIMAIDSLIVLFSGFVMHVFEHGLVNTFVGFIPVCGTLVIYLIPYLCGFFVTKTYSGIIRYSSFIDLLKIGAATFFGAVVIFVIRHLFDLDNILVPILDRELMETFLLATILMVSFRVLVKHLYDIFSRDDNAENVFIYGVKNGGVALAKSIAGTPGTKYKVAGFVSDGSETEGHELFGKHVCFNDEQLVENMRRKNAKTLLVSPLKIDLLRGNDKMIDMLTTGGIKIMIVEAAAEWDGKSDVRGKLKEVDIEDLLPRAQIEVDMEALQNALTGHRVLITGAAGSIGSEIVRQVAKFKPSEMVLIDQAETPLHDVRLMMAKKYAYVPAITLTASILNREHMEHMFAEHKPEFVFHAAAFKHVPMMEDNPGESVVNNVEGTRIIADLAVKYGVGKFVMISTDKAVNPTNVMGCSKRICEMYVQSLDKAIKEGKIEGCTQFVTTRFGNVLGSNGSVIPLFREQLKHGGPLTVTHPDIIRFFMLIPEACKLVLEAGTRGNGGEIFVFDMGEPVKIADLAKRMIALSGARDVKIEYTGLRDGEKLYEEVLSYEEGTEPSFHEKIRIARVRELDYAKVNAAIDEMVEITRTYDDMSIVKAMKDLVPEYKSKHSKYEVLDK